MGKEMLIDKNTISTIVVAEDGTATLKFYKNCETVFEKNYSSFKNARMAECKLMKKYC